MLPGDPSSRMCVCQGGRGDPGAEPWSEGLGERSFPVPVPPLLVWMGADRETFFPHGRKGVPASALKLENCSICNQVISICAPSILCCENTLFGGCLLHKGVDSGQGNGLGVAGVLLSHLLLFRGEAARETGESLRTRFPHPTVPRVMGVVCHGPREQAPRAGLGHGAVRGTQWTVARPPVATRLHLGERTESWMPAT